MTSKSLAEIDEFVEELLLQAPALITHEELAEYKTRAHSLINTLIASGQRDELNTLLEAVTVPEGHFGVLSGSKIRDYLKQRLKDLENR